MIDAKRSAPVSDANAAPLRAVLDSNVLISLLVFGDPRYALISVAWRAGSMSVLTDSACAEEFRRVLSYPELNLELARQQVIYAEFSRATCTVATLAGAMPPLPKCKDADDQKFLELALRAGASLLVTGDKALLALNRARHRLPFEILTADALEHRLAENGIIRREK